jgi:uncharacterized membrane protein YagU involved in acid resistance
MEKSSRQTVTSAGDAAVDGLIFGVVAGLGMGLYLLLAGLTGGDSVAVTLARFDASQTASPLMGLFTHLAVSAVYGAVFALGWRLAARLARVPVWAGAAAYGLLLWALAATVFLSSGATPLRATPPVHFAVAHLIYGLLLGVGMARRR